MSKLILSVSYDESLLKTRHALLDRGGYAVTSALGFEEAVAKCKAGAFDLFIMGPSIPDADKGKLIKAFRSKSASPIFSLWQRNEQIASTADYLAFSDNPEALLKGIATIFATRAAQTST